MTPTSARRYVRRSQAPQVLSQNIPYPLPFNGPPHGFGYDQRSISQSSITCDFNDRLKERDSWNSEFATCAVCGLNESYSIRPCYIIPQSEVQTTWADLKRRNYIPQAAKSPQHEPRNAILLCGRHLACFSEPQCDSFFIRFVPKERKFNFVYINFSRNSNQAQYHGKAINLNPDDRHAPFPAIFLIHEMRVRGVCPFYQEPNDIPTIIQFQDWMEMDSKVTSETRGTSNTNSVNYTEENREVLSGNFSGGSAPGMMSLSPLNDQTIQGILTAARESASWKACVLEGTSWDGTADENAEKYRKLAEL